MITEARLKALAAQGTRFFVRGYDSKNERWLFATDNMEDPLIEIGMDKGNPNRSAIHKTLMEIASRKNPGREGVQFTVGPMPIDPKGTNSNSGLLQILDIEETELSREARKVVVDEKVVGEWSKDLDRAVHRFADTMVMDIALSEAVRLDGNKQIFQTAVWAKARTFALQELGYKPNDPRLPEDVFKKLAPASMQAALYGSEPGANGKLVRHAYNPLEPQENQSPVFADLKARAAVLQPQETSNMNQMAINYGIQRALSEHMGEVCGEDRTLKKAEESLIEKQNLNYRHPARTDEDYKLSSREAGRQIGASAISGLMRATSDKPGDLNGWRAQDEFNATVLAEMASMPGFSAMPPEAKMHAYFQASERHLEQHSLAGRKAVYAEQIKVAAADKKQQEKDKGHSAQDIALGALGLAGKGVHHVTNNLQELERAPSLSL